MPRSAPPTSPSLCRRRRPARARRIRRARWRGWPSSTDMVSVGRLGDRVQLDADSRRASRAVLGLAHRARRARDLRGEQRGGAVSRPTLRAGAGHRDGECRGFPSIAWAVMRSRWRRRDSSAGPPSCGSSSSGWPMPRAAGDRSYRWPAIPASASRGCSTSSTGMSATGSPGWRARPWPTVGRFRSTRSWTPCVAPVTSRRRIPPR